MGVNFSKCREVHLTSYRCNVNVNIENGIQSYFRFKLVIE